MTFSTLVTLAAAASGPLSERADLYDCLDRYAQVALLGSRTAASVALDAITACSQERTVLQKKLLRAGNGNGPTSDGPAFARTLAEEDRAAALRVIAFVSRHRRPR